MRFKLCAVGLACALGVPSLAMAGKWDDTQKPDKSVSIMDWTPVQQYKFGDEIFNTTRIGRMAEADMFGDKVSQLVRAQVVDECLRYAKPDAEATAVWAICGDDAKALDPKKAEAEVKGEVGDDRDGERAVEFVQTTKDKAMKIGAAVEAAAKDDKGLQQILKIGDDARAEWKAYVGKNGANVALMMSMFDGIRSNKSNHKSFDGCWDKTYPAFSKLVKATKFPWELENDYLPGYFNQLLTTTDSFVTATAFAECSYAQHKAGEALVAAAFNHRAGLLRVGPRTIAASNLSDEEMKVKFADRSLSWRPMWQQIGSGTETCKVQGINDIAPIMTPNHGVIGKVKVDGDVAMISFKGDSVEECLQWADTNKVQSVNNGNVMYEKKCLKRGKVANQENDTEVPAKFVAGLKAGVSVLIVYNMPVTAWSGKKFVAIFGVAGEMKQK